MDDPSVARTPSRKQALAHSVRLPLVSGKSNAAILLACFALTSLIIFPLKGHLPMWIDVEILLGVWWLVWSAALICLLYHGHRVADDHTMGTPRNWLSIFSGGKSGGNKSSTSGSGWALLDILDVGVDFEGCAILIAIILALCVAFIGLWLLVEIVIPGLAFLAYLLVRGMLARVANDKHDCQGNLLRATFWGALWATVYIAPQVLLVWLVHIVWKKPPGA